MGSGQLIMYVKCDLIFVEQYSIHRSKAKYILRKKKPNELQVHCKKIRHGSLHPQVLNQNTIRFSDIS